MIAWISLIVSLLTLAFTVWDWWTLRPVRRWMRDR